jgi:hypothetical protein
MDDDRKSNVVPLRKGTPIVTAPPAEEVAVDAVRILARIATLDLLGYERARSRAAKELGCRLSFLDRNVARIRDEIQSFKKYVQSENEQRVGNMINVNMNDGTVVQGLCLASGQEWDDRGVTLPLAIGFGEGAELREVCLILLADNNFTVTLANPISQD